MSRYKAHKKRSSRNRHANAVARDRSRYNLSKSQVKRIWKRVRTLNDQGILSECGVKSRQLRRRGPAFTKLFLSEVPNILKDLETERRLLADKKAKSKIIASIHEYEAKQWLHAFGFSLSEVLSYTYDTQKAIVEDIRECQFTLLRKPRSVRRYIRAAHRLEYIWLSDGVRPDRKSEGYPEDTAVLSEQRSSGTCCSNTSLSVDGTVQPSMSSVINISASTWGPRLAELVSRNYHNSAANRPVHLLSASDGMCPWCDDQGMPYTPCERCGTQMIEHDASTDGNCVGCGQRGHAGKHCLYCGAYYAPDDDSYHYFFGDWYPGPQGSVWATPILQAMVRRMLVRGAAQLTDNGADSVQAELHAQ